MKAATNNNVRLLATLVDPDEDEESEYRFLVDGRHVKYVTVAPGILPKNDRTFGPAVIASLPPFPPGDWNEGHVGRDSACGEPILSALRRPTFQASRQYGTQLTSTTWSSTSLSAFARTSTKCRTHSLTAPWWPNSPSSPGRHPTSRLKRQPISGLRGRALLRSSWPILRKRAESSASS